MAIKIKGKQIADATITQSNLAVTTDSIVSATSVTTKEYVDTYVSGQITGITYATTNLNMSATNTTAGSGSQLACNTAIASIPNSNVKVLINGIEVNVGGTSQPYDCFFSPNGTTVRLQGEEQVGDYLYWNTNDAKYQLETTDGIDFIYLTLIN
jgi:hypothetical protein